MERAAIKSASVSMVVSATMSLASARVRQVSRVTFAKMDVLRAYLASAAIRFVRRRAPALAAAIATLVSASATRDCSAPVATCPVPVILMGLIVDISANV